MTSSSPARDTSGDPLSEKVIGAAIEVHRGLGPGLLESAYGDCFEYEMREIGLSVAREVPLAIQYKKLRIPNGYRMDFVIEGQLLVELKTVEQLLWIHEAQLLYLPEIERNQTRPFTEFQCSSAKRRH